MVSETVTSLPAETELLDGVNENSVISTDISEVPGPPQAAINNVPKASMKTIENFCMFLLR